MQVKYHETLLGDLDTLIQKESEYFESVQNIYSSLVQSITKVQALVRGFFVRRAIRRFKSK